MATSLVENLEFRDSFLDAGLVEGFARLDAVGALSDSGQ